jgi:hypothetical protein
MIKNDGLFWTSAPATVIARRSKLVTWVYVTTCWDDFEGPGPRIPATWNSWHNNACVLRGNLLNCEMALFEQHWHLNTQIVYEEITRATEIRCNFACFPDNWTPAMTDQHAVTLLASASDCKSMVIACHCPVHVCRHEEGADDSSSSSSNCMQQLLQSWFSEQMLRRLQSTSKHTWKDNWHW